MWFLFYKFCALCNAFFTTIIVFEYASQWCRKDLLKSSFSSYAGMCFGGGGTWRNILHFLQNLTISIPLVCCNSLELIQFILKSKPPGLLSFTRFLSFDHCFWLIAIFCIVTERLNCWRIKYINNAWLIRPNIKPFQTDFRSSCILMHFVCWSQ